ncbi:hypothetical protein [Streptomyces sp. TLI_171]|uniref:hypothetical protein n=1 Tax=Streptomyces sp. TLI_171 TaxID=1938859 RepID=UPI00117F451D|nr:hypothetical protein [Streptomyces sp. TLI_171]
METQGHQPSDDPRESERLLAFAELALNNGSPAEALAAFAQLRGTGARSGEARALEALGRNDEAAALHRRLWERTPPGTVERAEHATGMVRCHRLHDDVTTAVRLGETALGEFGEHRHAWHGAAVRLGVTLAGALTALGELSCSQYLLNRLAAVADTLGEPASRGAVRWNASLNAHLLGRPVAAYRLSMQALALFGETDLPRHLAVVRGIHGRMIARAYPDRWREGLDLVLRSAAELSELGQGDWLVDTETEAAEILVRADRPAQALPHLYSALARPQQAESLVKADTHLVLAEALAALGDTDGCAAEVATAAAMLGSRGRRHSQLAREWHRTAALYRHLGDPARALRAYEHALVAAGHGGPVWG